MTSQGNGQGHSEADAPRARDVSGALVRVDGREWYEIVHADQLPPFFMSLVSSTDAWWFVASTGGMTMGRRDADHALLPYETEDKITHGVGQTGPLTIVRVHEPLRAPQCWEPLRLRWAPEDGVVRRLRKSVEGDALAFEESHAALGLTYTMTLRAGDEVGFVRTVELRDDAGRGRRIEVLDGYQNLLPHGASQALQSQFSVLLDAYKRSEIDSATGVAFFSLSSHLTDRAEASECLRANVLWSAGLPTEAVLLTPDERIDAFRRGREVVGDADVRGRRGAYLALASFDLPARGARRWHVVADVSLDAKSAGRVRAWQRDLDDTARAALIEEDVARGTAALRHLVGCADGLSVGGDRLATAHHFANTLFNVMRGGVVARGGRVDPRDVAAFVATRNRFVHAATSDWWAKLPAELPIGELLARSVATRDPDIERLAVEYLPLVFSRRHGDPSRPWNHFAIRLKNPDGSARTDYQGNWRDIFQNWEPLAHSYPTLAYSMVAKFLNATTMDGYNPYRVTRDGIEWEVPEPDAPWANFGYWGDHQIIYLQKLLEVVEGHEPGRLARGWGEPTFTSADVPYRIVPYERMCRDWSRTIEFDVAADRRVAERVRRIGTDGRLVPATTDSGGGELYRVSMVEKLVVLLLAKLTNLVPGAGIWMNTQRPEWNDANNALVGKGVSVVTAAYVRRFLVFFRDQLETSRSRSSFVMSRPVATLVESVSDALGSHPAGRTHVPDDVERRRVMDSLGAAATAYRSEVYGGPPATWAEVSIDVITALVEAALEHVDCALACSRRSDGLFHGYWVLGFGDDTATVMPLDLMLEGQVALLSSGFLSPAEALELLSALARSALYAPSQRSYLLYPNRTLPGFLLKNSCPVERIAGSELASALMANGDDRLVVVDPYDGQAHFGGDLRNAVDLRALLDALAQDHRYAALVEADRRRFEELFEDLFDHRSFTGRSGTFFAYEGLGSVYWHMVSKLLLAVQECHTEAMRRGEPSSVIEGLAQAYEAVRTGLGVAKTPAEFGAFPIDPYSHTPETGGARQPGMTGQVKEAILTRAGELGVRVEGGQLHFEPRLLHTTERLPHAEAFSYVDVEGRVATRIVPAGGLGFTVAQTPVVYHPLEAGSARMRVISADGAEHEFEGSVLPRHWSAHVFARDGSVRAIDVWT